MKKSKLLILTTSVVSSLATIVPLTTVASCACSKSSSGNFDVTKDTNIELVTCSNIELNKKLSIVVTCKTGYEIDSFTIKVGGTQLSTSQYSVDENIITIQESAMTSTNVSIDVKSKLIESETPTVKLKYDALKDIDIYSYQVTAINYPFECNSIASFFGLKVTITNFKIDDTAKAVPSDLISWKLSSEGDIIVDLETSVLISTFSISSNTTVTFDLTFTNTSTQLNKQITGFTIDITQATKPATGSTLPWNNDIWWSHVDTWFHGFETMNHPIPYALTDILYNYPQVVEQFGYTNVEVGQVDEQYKLNHIVLQLDTAISAPCLETLTINNTNAKTLVLSIYNYDQELSKFTNKDEPKTVYGGFKTIDLGKNMTEAGGDIYISGAGYNMSYNTTSGEEAKQYIMSQALYENENLNKIVFSSKRKTIIQSKCIIDNCTTAQAQYNLTEENTPFYGCINLNTFDVSDFTTVDDIANVVFDLGKTKAESKDIKIFNTDMNTNATTGTIIVAKDATSEMETAWKTKFEAAGLTIDGTNWKIVHAE